MMDPAQDVAGADPSEVTRLLERARAGERAAVDALFALVYRELHGLARAQLLLQGRPGSTLDTTALVHEAYLRLVAREALSVDGRVHFFSLAARVMRHMVIDAFRRRGATKHGGQAEVLDLDRAQLPVDDPELGADIIALGAALDALEATSPDLSRLVEMRFFAGMALSEMAPLLGRSERTLKRDWRRARAFLLAQMTAG